LVELAALLEGLGGGFWLAVGLVDLAEGLVGFGLEFAAVVGLECSEGLVGEGFG
jgi:hypothetical protein